MVLTEIFRPLISTESRRPCPVAPRRTTFDEIPTIRTGACGWFLGAAAATGYSDHDMTKAHRKDDARVGILRRFLQEKHSPAASYAETFILEADAHRLDWRLLPSLAFGGIRRRQTVPAQQSVRLGQWRQPRFPSVTAAIHHVAEALAEARPYKGKTIQGKLAAYNESPDYKTLVLGVMRRISPLAVSEAL